MLPRWPGAGRSCQALHDLWMWVYKSQRYAVLWTVLPWVCYISKGDLRWAHTLRTWHGNPWATGCSYKHQLSVYWNAIYWKNPSCGDRTWKVVYQLLSPRQASLPKDVSLSPWHRGKNAWKILLQASESTGKGHTLMAMPRSSPTTPFHLLPCNTSYTIFNYAEQHALLLPGRLPGYSRSDIQLIPSSDTKRAIWRSYITAAEADATIRPVAYTTFCHLWKKLTPSIVIMKPRSDLRFQGCVPVERALQTLISTIFYSI